MIGRVIRITGKLKAVLLSMGLLGILGAAFSLASNTMPAFLAVFDSQDLSAQEEQIKLPVLMYHHILRQSKLLGDYCITPEEFEGDLRYIKEMGYETVTTKQLIDYCEKGVPLPEKPIFITFDDGYESSYVYAYPLLKKYGMTACVSLIGYYSDLYTQTEDRHINYSHITWGQVHELSQSGVIEFGNHTYRLHSLDEGRKGIRIKNGEDPQQYQQMLFEDLSKTQIQIERQTGYYPLVFAYPFGASCSQAEAVIDQMGFSILLTCEEKVNVLTGDPEELKSLGRFNRPHNVERENFFSRILN